MEESSKFSGKIAQKNNIMAAKIVADTVRTTLGPKGMDKMLVNSSGEVIVTNDGVTILEEMHIEHPAARMIVEIAKTQESEVGDGTTTAVIFAGELLKQAEKLLEKSVHPTVLIKGYRLALKKSKEYLEQISENFSISDIDLIKRVAITAMTGKGAESSKDLFADLITKAVLEVNSNGELDRSSIRIEKKTGSSIELSELINGIVIDKEKVHSNMPSKIENAKIALIDDSLEIKSTEMDAKISITNPNQMEEFLNIERQMLIKLADKIISSGADVIFCKKGIDDEIQNILAEKGIYALRRVKPSDLEALSKATGAKIVANVNSLDSSKLGNAGIVEEVKFDDEYMTFVRNCMNPKSVTLLLRGASEHVIDEIKRALEDAIGDVASALKNKRVVAGAGSTEMELSKEIRKFANTLSGREQLSVIAFAESLEVIPITLAENAGLDPIDILVELKSIHDSGKKWAGLDVFSGDIIDAFEKGVIEPLNIKIQAISSATEVSIMILRIDDVIASGSFEDSKSN